MSFNDILFCERAYWIYAVIIYIISLLIIFSKLRFEHDSDYYDNKDNNNNFQVIFIKIENKFCIQGLCK